MIGIRRIVFSERFFCPEKTDDNKATAKTKELTALIALFQKEIDGYNESNNTVKGTWSSFVVSRDRQIECLKAESRVLWSELKMPNLEQNDQGVECKCSPPNKELRIQNRILARRVSEVEQKLSAQVKVNIFLRQTIRQLAQERDDK